MWCYVLNMNMNIKFEYAGNKQKGNLDRFYSGQGITLTFGYQIILDFFCENSVVKRLVKRLTRLRSFISITG